MAGRKRKPEALKRLEGTFRKDRAGNSVELPAGMPVKPEWTEHDPIASELYNQVASHCYSMGVGTAVDSIAVRVVSRSVINVSTTESFSSRRWSDHLW